VIKKNNIKNINVANKMKEQKKEYHTIRTVKEKQ
jgi:hypothetical protein